MVISSTELKRGFEFDRDHFADVPKTYVPHMPVFPLIFAVIVFLFGMSLTIMGIVI